MFSRAPIGLCPYVMMSRVELGLRKVRDQKFAVLLASQRKMMKTKHSEVFNPVKIEYFSRIKYTFSRILRDTQGFLFCHLAPP